MAQVEGAPNNGKRRLQILIEGGINDVGETKIVDLRTSPDFIRTCVEQACYCDMKTVMARLGEKYPAAEIYLFGY